MRTLHQLMATTQAPSSWKQSGTPSQHVRKQPVKHTGSDIHQRGGHDRDAEVPGTNRKEPPLTTEFQLLLLDQIHQI